MPRTFRTSVTPSTAVLAVLALATVGGAVLSLRTASATPAEGRVVTARKGVVQSTVSASGNLQAARSTDLDFQTSGRVTKVLVEPGQKVVEGQILARLDSARQRVAVAQAEAALEEAEDQLESAGSGSSTIASAPSVTTTTAGEAIRIVPATQVVPAGRATLRTVAATTTGEPATTPPTTTTTTTPGDDAGTGTSTGTTTTPENGGTSTGSDGGSTSGSGSGTSSGSGSGAGSDSGPDGGGSSGDGSAGGDSPGGSGPSGGAADAGSGSTGGARSAGGSAPGGSVSGGGGTSGAGAPGGGSASTGRGSGGAGGTEGSGGAGGESAAGATSVASAEASVRSAELDLKDAQEALAATILRAPFAGTIASVDGEVGDTAGSSSGTSSGSSGASGSAASSGSGSSGAGASDASGPTSTSGSGFITLTNLERLDMEVSVSESDVGQLEVGQAAAVTVTALDDARISATVTRIGVLPSSTDGVVSYPVTLKLKQTAEGIRPGMTATAEVVVDQARGAVSVPAQAVQGSGDRARVIVRRDGDDEVATVITGITGDSAVQIISGLEAGDQVVLPALQVTSSGGTTGSGGVRQRGTGAGFPGGGMGGARLGGGGGISGGGVPGGGRP
ncbi:MAG: biotin/lipoyl-binding protein [Solirubrobacteraceae bacterium]